MEAPKEETNKTCRYDRNKNEVILTLHATKTVKNDKGETSGYHTISQEQHINPEEFKKWYKQLNGKKVEVQGLLKKAQQNIDLYTIGKDYDELLELKSKLMALQKLDNLEKNKKDKDTLVEQLQTLNEDLRSFESAAKSLGVKK